MILEGWGRNIKIKTRVIKLKNEIQLKKIKSSNKIIARGNGRSYGDSSLQNQVVKTTSYDKIIKFDKKKGIITVTGGVTIEKILNKIIPHGWFLPVTPGSKFITVGGMIASNVHGKNQHVSGSFKNYVLRIKILNKKKKIILVSKNKKDFNIFFGSMGLFGLILEAEIKLTKIINSYINQKTLVGNNLNKTLKILYSTSHWTYSVGWVDCLAKNNFGRSVIFLGEHNKFKKYELQIKKDNKFLFKFFIKFFLNKFSLRFFNILYFYKNLFFSKNKLKVIDYNSFFYPLDKISNWNKVYGKKGFIQYQFILPKNKKVYALILNILELIKKSEHSPYLCTIKMFKKEDGFFNFYLDGISMALDFPNKSNLKLFLKKLTKIIYKNNGKIYLTKDSFLTKNEFEKMYYIPKKLRKLLKSNKKNEIYFSSLQSERLGLT